MAWLRTVLGLIAGGAMTYAGGGDWKHAVAGIAVAALGVATHLTSTSTAGQ